MIRATLPLEEKSIADLFNGSESAVYEVPVYQRNYAWEKDEIAALIQDVYDSYKKDPKGVYYIGTLVSFHKGDHIYEVIDGQQRLTTIRLILGVLGINPKNKLTYRARKKSDETIKHIPTFDVDETDHGIVNGFKYAQAAICEIVNDSGDPQRKGFTRFFQDNVHIIHYHVPKDIDLNHYFEIMNSRGEQLEKHEIIKARLLSKLKDPDENAKFNAIWENCSELSVYIQQKFSSAGDAVFGKTLREFIPESFEAIRLSIGEQGEDQRLSINDLISMEQPDPGAKGKNDERPDSFQPIIDFSNFLLIVLKLTRIAEDGFNPTEFNLDDKELIREFDQVDTDEAFVRRFGFNLLKARFLLDNYLVHHSNEDDTYENNPWKLQVWQKDEARGRGYLKNLTENSDTQNHLAHLLSMFEVSFTARQRKNYLFYCLLYLFGHDIHDIEGYLDFVSGLAEKYINNVYMVQENLNAINVPLPGSFDDAILGGGKVPDVQHVRTNTAAAFEVIYGDGTEESKGIPLFVFNYIDYRLWKKYAEELRGEAAKEGSQKRQNFFDSLGCSDFGLDVFRLFYFSRTRRSLEHYYAQALATGTDGRLDQNQINCLGNYAMIGGEANSAGSNWTPKSKLDHYLDASGKIRQISVATLKFMIMMQVCKDNRDTRDGGQEWNFEDIKNHQKKILSILFGDDERSMN